MRHGSSLASAPTVAPSHVDSPVPRVVRGPSCPALCKVHVQCVQRLRWLRAALTLSASTAARRALTTLASASAAVLTTTAATPRHDLRKLVCRPLCIMGAEVHVPGVQRLFCMPDFASATSSANATPSSASHLCGVVRRASKALAVEVHLCCLPPMPAVLMRCWPIKGTEHKAHQGELSFSRRALAA